MRSQPQARSSAGTGCRTYRAAGQGCRLAYAGGGPLAAAPVSVREEVVSDLEQVEVGAED